MSAVISRQDGKFTGLGDAHGRCAPRESLEHVLWAMTQRVAKRAPGRACGNEGAGRAKAGQTLPPACPGLPLLPGWERNAPPGTC